MQQMAVANGWKQRHERFKRLCKMMSALKRSVLKELRVLGLVL